MMSQFYLNKKGEGKHKDFVMKCDGLMDNKKQHRIGKVHFNLSEHFGAVNKPVKLYLHSGKVTGATVDFNISICQPELIRSLDLNKVNQEFVEDNNN